MRRQSERGSHMKELTDILSEGLVGSRSRNVASLGEVVAGMFERLLGYDEDARQMAFMDILSMLEEDSIPLVKEYSGRSWSPIQIQSENPLIIVMSCVSSQNERVIIMNSVQLIHPMSRRGVVICMYDRNVTGSITGYERYEDMQPVNFRDGQMYLADTLPIWIVRKESPVRGDLDAFMERAYESSSKWRWS